MWLVYSNTVTYNIKCPFVLLKMFDVSMETYTDLIYLTAICPSMKSAVFSRLHLEDRAQLEVA